MADERWGPSSEEKPRLWAQGLFEQSATKKQKLGSVRVLDDGREFIYCLDSGSGISAGLLIAAAITTPVHEDTVTVAHPVGTKVVTVTAAGATAHQFQDGMLVVTDGGGAGECYKIKDNDAADGSNLIRVQLYEGLETLWATGTTDVDLYANPCNGVYVNPVDAQQKPVGVAQRPITASKYFWAQKKGLGAMKINVLAAGGLELDEKVLKADAVTAGWAALLGSPANTDVTGVAEVVGILVKEEDVTDDTTSLVDIKL